MAQYGKPDDLMAEMRALAGRVKALETASPRRNASAAVFTDYPAVPTQTTTSGSWTAVQRASHIRQHPMFRASVVVNTESGTTGEVRLWNATLGEQVGSTITVPASTFQVYEIPATALGGAHMDTVNIELQLRRTGGAGTIGAYVTAAFGVRS